MSLDESTVLAAAWDVLDERGLDGYTLRALAERLDVSQLSMYEMFESRAAVIDLLADDPLTRIRWDEPDLVADPDERILGHALRAREAMLAHPELVPVIAARPLVRTSRRADLLRLHTTCAEAGFPDERIVPSILSLVSVTIGLVLFEQQRRSIERDGPRAISSLRSNRDRSPSLPSSGTPYLSRTPAIEARCSSGIAASISSRLSRSGMPGGITRSRPNGKPPKAAAIWATPPRSPLAWSAWRPRCRRRRTETQRSPHRPSG